MEPTDFPTFGFKYPHQDVERMANEIGTFFKKNIVDVDEKTGKLTNDHRDNCAGCSLCQE